VELTTRGRRVADLCRDLYTLAQDVASDNTITPGPARGWRWENRIANTLAHRGYPVEAMPGGVRVFGVVPASGLCHQTDAALSCADAHVIGEWKSYTGSVPKNELLRFKAATDDLYDTLALRLPRQPVLRLFGVGGDVSSQLRWYAARHGIALVERTRWPAPVLADPDLAWPADGAPSTTDLRRLRWLSRPLQQVYPQLPDGSLRLPPPLPDPAVDALLTLQDRWSARLWALLDAEPGSFERFAADLVA
jgi:hypothetical protein